MEQRYIAFISYRHAPMDMAAAKTLHGLIEQFHIPKALRKDGRKRFGRVFRDQEELSAASDLSENICRALDKSEYLVVVCSPAAAQSPWVGREVEYFLRHHDRRKAFAVLLDGEPAEVFPSALTEVQNADGSITKLEPLAVDARGDNISAMRRKLRREVFRLYAAMLGCPYDALVQRQQRRRRRQAAAAVSAVLAVALGFSGMMLVKNQQIDLKNQELESKNEELVIQKNQILLRESELLTQNAEEAMAEGNYSAAMGYAVDALPKEGDAERPYYAPAERVMMEALDIFDNRDENYLLIETEIEQLSAISDFLFSPDGKRLVTYDDFGTINCFDSKSGELLWTAIVPASGASYYVEYRWPIICCEAQNSIIALYEGTVAAFDFESGEKLWQSGSLSIEDGHIQLSPDGSRLVCLVRELIPETGMIYHKLIVLSSESGEVLQEIKVGEAQPINFYISDAEEGAFSTDGRYYAFSRCVLEYNVSTLSYFVADLAEGTARCVYSEAVSGSAYEATVEKLSFTQDGAALLAARLDPEGAINACVERIDIESGKKLWKALPEAEEGENVLCSGSDEIHTLHTASKTYLVRGNALYCIDNESGGTDWYTLFPAKLSSIDIVQNQFFSYVQQDGCYALAWKNDGGLYSSELYSATAALGSNSGAKLCNDGFICAEVEDFSIESITVAGGDGRGRVAVMPSDSGHKLSILRSCESPSLSGARSADISDEGSIYSPNAALYGGELVVGPFTRDSGENRHLAVFDSESLSLKQEIAIEHLTDTGTMPYVAESSSYIQDDGYGGIVIHYADGKAQTLSESSNVMLYDSDIVSFTACEYLSRTVVQPADGSVLSARCSAEELRLWKNGGLEAAVPLPEDMIWALSDNTVFHRIFELGENGLAVLSRFDNGDDLLVDSFAVYDCSSGEWTFVDDAGGGEADRICCVGQSSPTFAVAEHDGTVRVYREGEEGFKTSSFSLLLPLSSVDQMSFILGDTVMMVKTGDSQLLFYDVESGEVLLRQQLGTVNLEKFSTFEDSENRRLYVFDSCYAFGVNGYLIDLGSWTVLAELEGAVCYDAAKNELYRISGGRLSVSAVPATAELVETAQQLLEK